MSDDGAGVLWVDGGDAAQEGQERARVFGYTMVRPGGVLELLHLAAVRVAHLVGEQQVGLG